MKKFISFLAASVLCVSSHAQYQVENSDFEKWEDVASAAGIAGQEPIGWNSYLTATGTHVALVNQSGALLLRSNDVRPGSKGQYSALLKARNLLTKNLYGDLTTGCANVTGMNPKDGTSYYNYTNPGVDGQAMTFTGRPDSVKVWVKLCAAEGNNGLISVILHSNGTYKTPILQGETFQTTAQAITQAVQMVEANGEWTCYSLPMGYTTGLKADPSYALVSFQTSNEPGEGDKAATMYVDDMEFIYNSELSAITYAGMSILKSTSIDAVYEPSKLSGLRSNGVSATLETSFDETTHVLTVTVKGGDIEANPDNKHVYTFQFKAPKPDDGPIVDPDPKPEGHQWPDAGTNVSYTDDLQVTVNSVTNPAQQYTIEATYKSDGLITLNLNNFVLLSAGDEIPIGNIVLDDVQLVWNKEKNCADFNKTENVYITAGTLPGVEFWMGPMLNSMYGAIPVTMTGYMTDDKLYVKIYINMMNTSLGQMIYVTFGDAFTPEPGPTPDPKPSYKELPTSGEKVYSDELYVQINSSLNGPMPADVIVTYHDGNIDFALNDFCMESDGNIMYVGNIFIPNLTVTHTGNGVYTYSFHDTMEIGAGSFDVDEWDDPIDWLGPMLGPLQLGLDGKISVDKAYVTIDIPLASMGQNIHVIFGSDEFTTAIKQIMASQTQQGVFDLSGRRVSQMLKGKVYVVNGKKILK